MYSASSRKPRVLVADDEKIIADTLKLILARAGYEVSVAYDGIEAVNIANEWLPDLFLSDVFMPGFSGIEAAIKICERLPDCKVLLMSGQGDSHDLRREIESKCRGVQLFSKPVPPTKLIAHLRTLL